MIPKVIHYCWFGGNEKPDIVIKCIESWKQFCPEWEIHEWNENSFDVLSVPFMKEAYEKKKWAFVSDVARLLIIYQLGGVYLDTDVELHDSIDSWLDNDAFYIFESNRNIATGLGFGAIKGQASVKAMLDYYEGKHFVINGKVKMKPCPAGNTESLKNKYPEFKRNDCSQQIGRIRVLSRYEYSLKAKHHGAATWVDGLNVKKKYYRNGYKETKLKQFLRDSRRFEFVEKYFGKRVTDIYTFISYDLLEMGIGYYCKRIVSRIINKEREL